MRFTAGLNGTELVAVTKTASASAAFSFIDTVTDAAGGLRQPAVAKLVWQSVIAMGGFPPQLVS
jgi:hypothetical protein